MYIYVCTYKSIWIWWLSFLRKFFGGVKLTKNAGIDNYKYLGYDNGFDTRGTFSFPIGRFSYNVIIFGRNIYLLMVQKLLDLKQRILKL